MVENTLICQIHQTSNCIDNYVTNYMVQRGKTLLTPMEAITLRIIYQHYGENEFSAKDLMRFTSLSKATTSQNLKTLQRKNFVQIKSKDDDKRKKTIRLTSLGLENLRLEDKCFSEMANVIQSQLSEEEVKILLKSLKQIRENVTIKK